ncbi:hypothetical protein DESUT3_14960 [Desulfuromonas versatilis]|uniref:YNCE-like beta-propeller domain-containing protein n=1 Tax=Desulfuromonas versatilis TaxID=2802975 RepID=A0ABN6DWF0_9BACT|nr:cytochrome D1 domain-containing protein [Desulfuromonas versatilis]BCR04427.1 hypothetical protein DESUT3_14960 [Desulfuromonas versatilis]
MFRILISVILATAFSALAPSTMQAEPPASPENRETNPQGETSSDEFIHKGVRVEFSIEPDEEARRESRTVREAEIAEIKFRITDAKSGAPISPLEPAVWVNLVKERQKDEEKLSCKDQIGLYLQGMLGFQADIDLNKFYMLVLNDDKSISVVDPILGVNGITQLYALITLKGRGEDWTTSENQKYLFVTMPEIGQVAKIDLETFKVVATLQAGSNTVRIALQPDGRYIWVGNNGADREKSGVTVINANDFSVAGFIPTGAGHHEIAFSNDSLFAYVTNSEESTLSVIDTQALKKTKDLKVGERPVALYFSELSRSAYVAAEADGSLTIVDGSTQEIRETLPLDPGLIALRFAPGDRWGFIANSLTNKVYILDASSQSVAHSLEIGNKPHQVVFTESFAYVRSLGTAELTLIPLKQLTRETLPGLQTIPIGTLPPGQYPLTSVADAIVPTGEYYTVLAVNPADRLVYYYMEGMNAAMGSFPTYGRVPRAVRVVDRSMQEKQRGVYSAKLRIPKEGKYDVAFLIDSPWVYNCFAFTAEPNPNLSRPKVDEPPRLEVLSNQLNFPVGRDFNLRFALKRRSGDLPLTGIPDVSLLVTRPPGNWQSRLQAKPLEDGTYEANIRADRPGVYSVYFAVPSLNFDYRQLPYIFLTATNNQTPEK